MNRFNPLKKYDKFLDVVEFLENNLSLTTDKIYVPYATTCYFIAPLFYKFKFVLNFQQPESYFFWNLYKANKFILPKIIDNFKYLNNEETLPGLERIMFEESSSMLKATLYLILCRQHNSIKDYGGSYTCNWSENFEQGFRDCLYKLNLKNVELVNNQIIDFDKFIIQNLVQENSIDYDKIRFLNSFANSLLIADNPTVIKNLSYDQRIDFEGTSVLIKAS